MIMLLEKLVNNKLFQIFIKSIQSKDLLMLLSKHEQYLIMLLINYLLNVHKIGIQVGKYGYSIFYIEIIDNPTLPVTIINETQIIYICTDYEEIPSNYYKNAIIQTFNMISK